MEDPTRTVTRFVEELWNQRRLEVADEIFSADCTTHQLRSGAPVDAVRRGPEAIKEHVTAWLGSFPDLTFAVEQMLADGGRVASHLVMEGTHKDTWLGIPATGRKIQIRMYTVHRVLEGRIVEDWVLADFLGVFQQLSALPDTAEIIRGFTLRSAKVG